jgi:hypothetical protein
MRRLKTRKWVVKASKRRRRRSLSLNKGGIVPVTKPVFPVIMTSPRGRYLPSLLMVWCWAISSLQNTKYEVALKLR